LTCSDLLLSLSPLGSHPHDISVGSHHKVGLKFKIYNTMRELSNHCSELFAMRAFGGTFVKPGEKQAALENGGIYEQPHASTARVAATAPPDVGVGADWLQEHVQTEYEIAWSNPVVNQYPGSKEHSDAAALDAVQKQWINNPNEQDAAIKVAALSRWNNYYGG
jgi:hypothetical protein